MAETTLDTPAGTGPVPRCCPAHEDWPMLAQHLLEDFPELTITDIVREVRVARDAVERIDLDEQEALQTGELIVRHQLLLRAGRVPDTGRLDPETHRSRAP